MSPSGQKPSSLSRSVRKRPFSRRLDGSFVGGKRLQLTHRVFAPSVINLASDRASSINSSTTGLRVRFFSVKMPTDDVIPKSTGRIFSGQRSVLYLRTEFGSTVMELLDANKGKYTHMEVVNTVGRGNSNPFERN